MAASFLPATTIMKSVESESERMVAERNVSFVGGCPATAGGQGSRALSAPMREDSPAARITPAKLGARDMSRTIAEREGNVSEPARGNQNWRLLFSMAGSGGEGVPLEFSCSEVFCVALNQLM